MERKLKIKAFGVTKDILGGKETVVETNAGTVAELRSFLNERFPSLRGLNSLYIAVNHQYAAESAVVTDADEIALIPPVSGG